MCENMASEIGRIPGLRAVYLPARPELDEFESATPRVYVYVEDDSGLNITDVEAALKQGDPPVYCYPGEFGRALGLSPVNLMEGEDEAIIRRFREVASG